MIAFRPIRPWQIRFGGPNASRPFQALPRQMGGGFDPIAPGGRPWPPEAYPGGRAPRGTPTWTGPAGGDDLPVGPSDPNDPGLIDFPAADGDYGLGEGAYNPSSVGLGGNPYLRDAGFGQPGNAGYPTGLPWGGGYMGWYPGAGYVTGYGLNAPTGQYGAGAGPSSVPTYWGPGFGGPAGYAAPVNRAGNPWQQGGIDLSLGWTSPTLGPAGGGVRLRPFGGGGLGSTAHAGLSGTTQIDLKSPVAQAMAFANQGIVPNIHETSEYLGPGAGYDPGGARAILDYYGVNDLAGLRALGPGRGIKRAIHTYRSLTRPFTHPSGGRFPVSKV